MRRLAVRAGCLAPLLVAGCAALGGRDDRPTDAQVRRRQQLSQEAQAAIDRGDLAGARVVLERLVAEAPRAAEAQHRLGRVLQAQGRLREAEAAYQKALVLEPEYVDAQVGLGEAATLLGDPEAALR
ncbi:MAG TPA: tetratricopeptide repeat protein, partial [Isosphaeraceae bacterium]